MQDCVNSNKIKENKYKILRMSLLLGSGVDREDTFNNFEDAAREIDAMNDEVYLKNIEDKFYDTLKLEEEEKKLSVLVDYIGGRVEQRISLLSDFANVTGYDLQNLPPIKYYDKLDDYNDRLGYIREYLSNIEQINFLNDEIEHADKNLNEAYLNRAASEEHNIKIENTLYDKFVNIFKTLTFFDGVNENNIEEKLILVGEQVEDSKKSLDIFSKSFNTLAGSGISVEEEEEYFSYVENAKCAFYEFKEQEYVFKIYRLLLSKYSDYVQILYKRKEINDILYERLKLRKDLKVSSNDLFSSIYDLLERQYEDIKRQSNDIENIEKLTIKINQKKDELNRLENENQKVEILSLLREFCIIDTYSDIANDEEIISDNVDIVEENSNESVESVDNYISDIKTEIKDDTSVEVKKDEIEKTDEVIDVSSIVDFSDEDILDNQVVFVENAIGVDLELIQSKASKVMKRVGEMLGIKVEETQVVSVINNELNEKSNEVVSNVQENSITPEIEVENNENPLFNNDLSDEDVEVENPLFTSDSPIDNLNESNPLFNEEKLDDNEEFKNPLFDNNISDEVENDFWFPSDMPDALNELPDLNVSNDDFFANNNVADLEFPDLNMDFPDDMEGKI